MKIKVKKLLLFEGTPAPLAQPIQLNQLQTQPVNAPASAKRMTVDMSSDQVKAIMENQYLNTQKKLAMAVDIILPSIFMEPYKIPRTPANLRNLMQGIPTGDNKKFQNIRGMMADPAKTFTAASDIAMDTFGNLQQIEVDKKGKKNEAYEYAYNEVLNEVFNYGNHLDEVATSTLIGGALATGAKGGAAVGADAAAVTNVATGFTLGAMSSFGAVAAPSIGALFGVGALGYRVLGDIGTGYTNDKELKNSSDKTSDWSGKDADSIWKNNNISEAIDSYLDTLINSVGAVFEDIVTGKTDNYDKLVSDVKAYISTDDEKLKAFTESTNEIVKKYKEELKTRLENRRKDGEALSTNGSKLSMLLSLSKSTKGEITTILKAWNYATNNGAKIPNEGKKLDIYYDLVELIDGGDATEIKEVYDKITTYGVNSINKNTSESIDYSFNNRLFEDASETESGIITNDDGQIVVDLTGYYKQLKAHFSTLIAGMFPLRGGDNLPGVKEAKEQMTKLRDNATKEITTLIELVCRTSSSGANNGLSTKVAGFLSKHPIKASKLTTLWGLHEQDLNERMTRRLNQMKDYGNASNILGWTVAFCKGVLPDIIARMLTLRHAVGILKTNGMYDYDSNMDKANREIFERDSESIMQQLNVFLAHALVNYTAPFSKDGNTNFITVENDKFVATDAIRSYCSVLIYHILTANNYMSKNQYGFVGPNAAKAIYDADDADDIISLFATALLAGGIDLLDANAIGQKFDTAKANITRNKKIIDTYYNAIKLLKFTGSGPDQLRSWAVLVNHGKTCMENAVKNIEDLKTAVDNYSKDSSDTNAAKVAEILNGLAIKMDAYRGKDIGLPNDGKDTLSKILQNLQSEDLDYFSIISLIWATLNNTSNAQNIFENTNSLEKICQNVYVILLLISSNALVHGAEIDPRTLAIITEIDHIRQLKDNAQYIVPLLNDANVDMNNVDIELLMANGKDNKESAAIKFVNIMCEGDEDKNILPLTQSFITIKNNITKIVEFAQSIDASIDNNFKENVNKDLNIKDIFKNVSSFEELFSNKVNLEELKVNAENKDLDAQLVALKSKLDAMILYCYMNCESEEDEDDEEDDNSVLQDIFTIFVYMDNFLEATAGSTISQVVDTKKIYGSDTLDIMHATIENNSFLSELISYKVNGVDIFTKDMISNIISSVANANEVDELIALLPEDFKIEDFNNWAKSNDMLNNTMERLKAAIMFISGLNDIFDNK